MTSCELKNVLQKNLKYKSEEKVGARKNNPSPKLSATWLSKFTIWWLSALFRKGWKQDLEADDIYDVLPGHQASYLCKTFEELRDGKHETGGTEKTEGLTLRRILFKTFGFNMFIMGLTGGILETIKVLQPIMLGYLVNYFDQLSREYQLNVTGGHQNESVTSSNSAAPISSTMAYVVGGCLAASGFLSSAPFVFYYMIGLVLAMRIRAGCSALIYKKVLSLSNKGMATSSSGTIVNLMSSDVEKFHFGLVCFHYLWIAPIQIAVCCILLYLEVGLAFIPALIFLVIIPPLQALIVSRLGKRRLVIAGCTDKRILVMNEIIGGMRVIKMYCWEKPFGYLVSKLRGAEMKEVLIMHTVRGQNEAWSYVAPKVITFLIILTYFLTGHDVTADKVVKIISWTEMLRIGVFLNLPFGAQFGTEMVASFKRIKNFLEADELQTEESKGERSSISKTDNILSDTENTPVYMKQLKARWLSSTSEGKATTKTPAVERDVSGDNEKPFLLDVNNIEIKQGELIGIVGTVGSGKSSVLMALLGEMTIYEGNKALPENVSYSPQESWVFSGTIQENVLFGGDYHPGRYQRILKACALDKDLELMQDGDQTFVGEKGFSLSGGQKARINLARAAYRDAEVYLLDDPLSAVDTKVGRHLFNQCIRGELKGKTRILVTHQIQYLDKVDRIIILRDGKVAGQGTHEEVQHQLELVRSLSEQHSHTVPTEKVFTKQMSFRGHLRTVSVCTETESLVDMDMEGLSGQVDEEEALAGNVAPIVYWRYFRAGYGALLFPLLLVIAFVAQGAYNFSDLWAINWHEKKDDYHALYVYAGAIGTVIVFGSLRSFLFFAMTCSAAKNLHNKMFSIILRAPISFFDLNPVGRILNRFSRDTNFMDDMLPQVFHITFVYGMSLLGMMVIVIWTNWWTLFATLPMLVVSLGARMYVMKSMRAIKRIEAQVRSPVYSHLSATLQGLPVIRAFRMQTAFTEKFYTHQDKHSSAWFHFIMAHRWLGYRLDWLVSVYFTVCIMAAFFIPLDVLDGGTIGLSLSYITGMLGMFQIIVRISAEVESYMTSVERIQQYTHLEQEAQEHTHVIPTAGWPHQGDIQFEHMCLSYKEGHNVLNDINLHIQPREKIGVVGRTGAGKSSLISCLFRLSEPTGRISIDGLNISELGLVDLRRKISIIPQDPVLFSGSLRYNLDPLDEYTDEEVWQSLQEVHLKDKAVSMPGGLEAEMSESGANFSVGQRQLVCLARAILRRNTIIVIDEATANVDLKTDKLIQQTLRTKFRECTVFCVAHRLNTIIDSDKVLVLDHGEVMQFDHPYKLLKDGSGLFHEMVAQTGKATATQLAQMALQAYMQMSGNEFDMSCMTVEGLPPLCAPVYTPKLHYKQPHGHINEAFEEESDVYDTYL